MNIKKARQILKKDPKFKEAYEGFDSAWLVEKLIVGKYGKFNKNTGYGFTFEELTDWLKKIEKTLENLALSQSRKDVIEEAIRIIAYRNPEDTWEDIEKSLNDILLSLKDKEEGK